MSQNSWSKTVPGRRGATETRYTVMCAMLCALAQDQRHTAEGVADIRYEGSNPQTRCHDARAALALGPVHVRTNSLTQRTLTLRNTYTHFQKAETTRTEIVASKSAKLSGPRRKQQMRIQLST
jgi:hypothetical protein